jgi:hypothetical protein
MGLMTPTEIEQGLQDTGGVQVTLKGVTTWGQYRMVFAQEEFGGDVRGANVNAEVPSVVIATQKLATKKNDRLTLTAAASLGLGWTSKKVVVLWQESENEEGTRTRLLLAVA